MSAPSITVLITTYNYGRFVEQAIDSVLSQDFPSDKLQIVVVDDGSTDDTQERLKSYGSRIEYFYQPNGGQASALNVGIAKARGEIIALLDADDLFLPGKLARITEAFGQDPALGMVYHRLRKWHMETGEYFEWEFQPASGDVHNTPDLFLSYVPHPTSAIAFRRSSLGPLLPIPNEIRMLADCYIVALIPFLSPVFAIPEFLAVYRIHGKNAYSTGQEQLRTAVGKDRLRMWQVVIDAMFEWLADHGYAREQQPVRDFQNLWTRHQKITRFSVQPPGRLRFFWYLVWENYATSPRQTWRFTLFNYMSALSALVFGYKRAHLMYEWRRRTLEMLQPVFGKRDSRAKV